MLNPEAAFVASGSDSKELYIAPHAPEDNPRTTTFLYFDFKYFVSAVI